MKILITTGIYPPDIGGPAQYVRGVEEAWKKQGHTVKMLAFRFERKLPTGIRHLYYSFRVLFSLGGVDFVFSPDTFSAALPALCMAKLCGKKIIIRTGGDFLWEQYVERTGDLVVLRNFYGNTNYEQDTKVRTETGRRKRLNRKEQVIFRLVRFLFRHADAVIFSTAWQRDIFEKPYHLDLKKCFIVENYYSENIKTQMQHTDKLEFVGVLQKVFVGGTRGLKWKNTERLRRAFAQARERRPEILLDTETAPRGEFLEKIRSAYAVILVSLGDISPNMILDAIAFGKPFILTRETGLYERLKDIGVWVNPESVEDVVAKIEWLSDEKNYAEQCKKVAAFSFTHSYDEIADEIIRIFLTFVKSS